MITHTVTLRCHLILRRQETAKTLCLETQWSKKTRVTGGDRRSQIPQNVMTWSKVQGAWSMGEDRKSSDLLNLPDKHTVHGETGDFALQHQ